MHTQLHMGRLSRVACILRPHSIYKRIPPPSLPFFSAKRPYSALPYFAANKLTSSDIEKVVSDDAILQKVMHNIRKHKLADSSVASLFSGAINSASGEHSASAYKFVLHTWRAVFSGARSNTTFTLQQQLYLHHEKVVHLMMNRGDYASFYELFVSHQHQLRQVHAAAGLGSFPSWAYTTMDVAQFSVEKGRYSYNSQSVEAFLKNPASSPAQKHQLNAMLLRKSLLYGPVAAPVIQRWVKYIIDIDDPQLSFAGLPLVYNKALRLLMAQIIDVAGDNRAQERLDNLQAILAEVAPTPAYFRLLSHAMKACRNSRPDLAIAIFDYKHKHHTPTPQDLTSVMDAYTFQQKAALAVQVYAAHPELHDDEQIVLLLRVSERTKNWKLLQQQFEDMYGKRDLPRVLHYAVVIGALASVGSQKEVERLFVQMHRRHLKPSYPVFRGMIRACINNNDYAQARVYYASFMDSVRNGDIDVKHIPRIEAEMLHITLFQSNIAVAMQAVEALFEKQRLDNCVYLDSEMVVSMIRFFSATYSKKEFLRVWQFAEEAELLNERVYYYGVSFYTKIGEFQSGNELASRAHGASTVPFQNNLIYKAQIKNYRLWIRQTPDKRKQAELRDQLRATVTLLDEKLEAKTISPRNLDKLLVELINETINSPSYGGTERPADRYFRLCKELGLLGEEAYLPFLRECARKNASFQDSSRILDLYREMVSSNIEISAQSYKYLMQALMKMDKHNKNGFKNSFILLESIFEIYGFNLGKNFMASSEGLRPKKVSDVQLLRNAVPLLEILSDFSIATTGNIDLIVRFLNQFRDQVADKMSFDFRLSILKEMSKVYLSYGNVNVTASLVNNALAELNDIADQFHIHSSEETPESQPDLECLVELPKLLLSDYSQVYDVQLQSLDKRPSVQPFDREYEQILQNCIRRNIRLPGDQFNGIFNKLLQESSSQGLRSSSLEMILNCSERFLVAGNWAEAMLFKKVSYIYRVFLRFLHQSQSTRSLFENYHILNEYYGIRTYDQLEEVVQQRARGGNALSDLKNELLQYNRMRSEPPWTMAQFFNNIAGFFTPEKLLRTRNFIRPGVAAQLVQHIEAQSAGSYALAFELYDRYPETMEYLLYFNSERPQIVRFRNEVERLSGLSASVAGEGRFSRRKASIRALRHLGRELRGRH